MTAQLPKCLIAWIYLQCYMNHAIKTHVTCAAVLSHYCLPKPTIPSAQVHANVFKNLHVFIIYDLCVCLFTVN